MDEKGDCAVVAAVSAAIWALTGETPVTTEDRQTGKADEHCGEHAVSGYRLRLSQSSTFGQMNES